MSLIKRMRKQKAVYWHPKGVNTYGEEQYELPVEIKCRWETEMIQGFPFEGKQTVYSTTIYVDREVSIGGLLKQCTLADLEGSLPPPADAERILVFERIPNLKCKEFLLVAKF